MYHDDCKGNTNNRSSVVRAQFLLPPHNCKAMNIFNRQEKALKLCKAWLILFREL